MQDEMLVPPPLNADARSCTRKLYSMRETLLGTVSYPREWDLNIRRQGYVHFHVFDPLEPMMLFREIRQEIVEPRVGTLRGSFTLRGGLELYGISLEEFEKLPGCSFSPSAAYLRSIVEHS